MSNHEFIEDVQRENQVEERGFLAMESLTDFFLSSVRSQKKKSEEADDVNGNIFHKKNSSPSSYTQFSSVIV